MHIFLFFFTLRVLLVLRGYIAKSISNVKSVCSNQMATKSDRTEPVAVLETECKKKKKIAIAGHF